MKLAEIPTRRTTSSTRLPQRTICVLIKELSLGCFLSFPTTTDHSRQFPTTPNYPILPQTMGWGCLYLRPMITPIILYLRLYLFLDLYLNISPLKCPAERVWQNKGRNMGSGKNSGTSGGTIPGTSSLAIMLQLLVPGFVPLEYAIYN